MVDFFYRYTLLKNLDKESLLQRKESVGAHIRWEERLDYSKTAGRFLG